MAESGFFTPRLFTPEEANALLPTLRRWLDQLSTARRGLLEAQRELAERFHGGRGNGHPAPGGELDRVHAYMQEAQAAIDEAAHRIMELGCELKDPDRGMVDFRTHREGRVVYLCWLMHEPEVLYWHELEAGYAGRQPL